MVGNGDGVDGNELVAANIDPEEAKELVAGLVYWPRQPYWTIEEGVLLASGYDPREATIDQAVQARSTSASARRTLDLLDHAQRALEVNQLPERPTPIEFVCWYEGLGFGAQFPKTLALMIHHRDKGFPFDENTSSTSKVKIDVVHPRQKGTLLKLLLAALHDGYGYRPGQRTDGVVQLASATERLGHAVSKQTIRNLVQEAIEIYGPPGDDEPD